MLFESVRLFTVSRVRNPTTDWHVVISDTAITLNQVNWLYFLCLSIITHAIPAGAVLNHF